MGLIKKRTRFLDAGLTRETLEEIERERDNLLQEYANLKARSAFATEKQVECVLRVLPGTVAQALREMPRLLTRDVPKAIACFADLSRR